MAVLIEDKNDIAEIISKIKDGSTVAISGFNISVAPSFLISELYDNYRKTGHPRNLFIEAECLPASPGKGLDLVAKDLYDHKDENFISGIMMPFLAWSPWLQKMTRENLIEAYTFSIGTAAAWFREVAASRPGLITSVGLGTFLDPSEEATSMNERGKEARRCYSSVLNIEGRDYLFYKAPKPDVAMIRGTTADEVGNMSMEDEAIFGTVLNIAQSAKAQPNPGIVMAQVERIARFGSISPKDVHVPGPIIDYVFVSPPEFAWQSSTIRYDPAISGTIIPPDPVNARRGKLTPENVIERRVALEISRLVKQLGKPIIMNLGIGIPTFVSDIIKEEGISKYVFSTVESGPWGGIPLGGENFGVSIGPFATITMPDQFNLYEGGIIDLTSLGFLQIDREGNVNPSLLENRTPGPGGFPVISAGSPRVYFAGRFTANGLKESVGNSGITIQKEGDVIKFVNKVYKVLFNGKIALRDQKEIMYITERAVFSLTDKGLVLKEKAPGIDLDKDILERMEFKPILPEEITEMDPRIFRNRPMGLRTQIEKEFKKRSKQSIALVG